MQLFVILLFYSVLRLGFGSVVTDEDPVHRGSEILPKNIHQRVLPTFGKAADPLGGLDPGSPEILHRNALQLSEQAQKLREAISLTFNRNEPSGFSRLDQLVHMASTAVLYPSLGENTILAKRWAAWWHKTHGRIPFDTRLDADQFLAYALARKRGDIASTSSINRFESTLNQDHDLVISCQYITHWDG